MSKKCIYCGNRSIPLREVIIPHNGFDWAERADYCPICSKLQNYRYIQPWEPLFWRIIPYKVKDVLYRLNKGFSFFTKAIIAWKITLKNNRLRPRPYNLLWMRLNGGTKLSDDIKEIVEKARKAEKAYLFSQSKKTIERK